MRTERLIRRKVQRAVFSRQANLFESEISIMLDNLRNLYRLFPHNI